MKARLLLTSALFLFLQIPAPQAQSVTVDVAKITCDQLFKEELPWTSTYIILWLSGYYHRERLSWMPLRTWDWANDAAHALALMPSPLATSRSLVCRSPAKLLRRA